MTNLVGQTTDYGVAGVLGESSTFNGVLGITAADGHAGVAGVCNTSNGNGVYGRSKQANGVIGLSSSNGSAGVAGANDEGNGNGVYGRSARSDGVIGITTGDGKAGVAGVCDTGSGNGVYGRSKAANGVVGYSSSDVHAGVAGANDNNGGVGVYGKGRRLAGLFEGNVQVTGSLVVGGVNVATLLQHIQQLQQQVADLWRRVGSGSGSGGTVTQTFINATLELGAGDSLASRLHRISGYGFQPGENVKLKITYRPSQTETPDTPRDTVITADALGQITFTSGVSCGSDPSKRPSWQSQATGATSGRVSNVTSAGC